MELLGVLVRLQAQTESLKRGEKPAHSYDPSPLRALPAALLSPDGFVGLERTGPEAPRVEDVHHRLHPRTKDPTAKNGVSLGFTSHYVWMRSRFGAHLVDGIAGENLLVQVARVELLSASQLARGVRVERADGGFVELLRARPAEPCMPFSRWALGPGHAAEAADVKGALQALRGGVRGFYTDCAGPGGEVRLGARVFVA